MAEGFHTEWQRQTQTDRPHDAVALMRAAGMEPDPWQVRVAQTPGDQLLLCHRQAGKSTIVAALALEDACAAPHTLVLLVSRSMRQSGELFRKVKEFYHATRPMPLMQDSQLSMELENHSRIISLPGTEGTIVGYSSVKRLILDEAARIADATYYAVRPMLAMSGGSLLALSTPFGQRGWFWEAWEHKPESAGELARATVEALLQDLAGEIGLTLSEDPGPWADTRAYQWTRTRVTALENRRLSKRFLAHERRQVPDLWFKQEWLCQFVALGEQVFTPEDIARMLHHDVAPLGEGWTEPVLRSEVAPLGEGDDSAWMATSLQDS